ncbi:MAG: hypothetical protein HC906_11570 [Bacteroidales bacterium]|nr:hypothetical protein [Bacteroidales bacterium]
MCEHIERCKLNENEDYIVFNENVKNPSGGRPTKEYALTLDSAKHIAMISGTEKGHEVRDYFIQFEKKAKNFIQHKLTELQKENEFLDSINMSMLVSIVLKTVTQSLLSS